MAVAALARAQVNDARATRVIPAAEREVRAWVNG